MARKYTLTSNEISDISALIIKLSEVYSSVDQKDFLANVTIYSHDLPLNLRKFLNEFRLADDDSSTAVISGFPIDFDSIGPTPSHWDNRLEVSPTLKEEFYLMLVSDLVANVFGWATQQGGYVCHDLMPVKDLETEQTGGSSECILDWHTEDAFHFYRGDYVGLLCLRNPDNTATTVGTLDLSLLSEDEIDLLFEPRFALKPDFSHKIEARGRNDYWNKSESERLERSYDAMIKADKTPPKVPILYGRRDAPFICGDPVYIDAPANIKEAAAFEAFSQALVSNLQDVILQPGDLVFLDNARVVHGRKSFTARFKGADRWLKRVNLTTDLRKSYPVRGSDTRRVIF